RLPDSSDTLALRQGEPNLAIIPPGLAIFEAIGHLGAPAPFSGQGGMPDTWPSWAPLAILGRRPPSIVYHNQEQPVAADGMRRRPARKSEQHTWATSRSSARWSGTCRSSWPPPRCW